MKKLLGFILLGAIALPSNTRAIDLKQSKFTQVVNNVEIISSADQSRHDAAVSDVFSMPDVLRTGPNSRAELSAMDGTITRVGANTIFSFDPSTRTIDLQQGSLLFHSPKGKGGGTIRTGSATASVIGTTIIVTCTPNGGFKLLDLEGQAEVRYLSGLNQTLQPGQMTFILPAGSASPIVVFRLDSETKGSALVSGFTTPLDSTSKINSEITQQLLQILNGTAADTGLIVGNNATPSSVQVVQDLQNQNNANTPPQKPPPPLPVPAAFQTDGSIVGSDEVSGLPVNYPPLDPNHVVNTPFAVPSGIESFIEGLSLLGIVNPASGYVGNNIDIDHANVDLSSFKANSDFDIMATGDIRIWQSVNFDGPEPREIPIAGQLPGVLALFAGGDLSIAPESTIVADTGKFAMVADSFSTWDTEDGGSIEVANTLEDITIYNDVGDIDILSVQDLSIYDSDIEAGGNVEVVSDGDLTLGTQDDVNIDAGGNVTLFAGLFSGGNMDVENSEIYAGDSDNGGSMNLNAGGDAYFYDDTLKAYSGSDGLGNISIDAPGTVDIENTYVDADGDVSIESGDTLYLGWFDDGDEIDAGGSVDLTSDNSDVDIYDYSIYAGGGVNITADFGNVNMDDVYISASGTVNISAGETISIYDDSTVSSDGDININASGAVDIYSSDTGDPTLISASGTITITALDTVDIYSEGTSITEIDAGGDLNISGNNGVYISDSDIYGGDSVSGGSITINSANGGVYISDGYISTVEYLYSGDLETFTGGNITITAAGTVDLYGEDTSYTYIDAAADVNITSTGGDVDIEDSTTIYAGDSFLGGSVTVAADDGNVDIDCSYITAYGSSSVSDGVTTFAGGDITITASGTVGIYDRSTIDAAADASLTSFGSEVDIEDSTIYGGDSDFGGSITVTADGGGVYISDSKISTVEFFEDGGLETFTGGNISITGAGTVSVSSSTIDAAADVNITSTGGDVDIQDGETDSAINAGDSFLGGSITVDAESGSVYISNAYLSASEDDTGGYITIMAPNGSIEIENSTLDADELVTVTAGGSVTVHDSQDSPDLNMDFWYVEAGTFVDLSADGDLDISDDSTVYADGGKISITSDGTVGGSIDISGDNTIEAFDGKVCILDEGTISLSGVDTDQSDFNITVDSSGIYADSGNLNMTDSGAEYDSEDTVSYDDITVSANNISITGSTLSASGTVSVLDEGTFSISGNSVSISGSDLEINKIDISGSTLTANDGNLSIMDNGSIFISSEDDAFVSGSTISGNNITITGGSILKAIGGDLDVYDNGEVTTPSDIPVADISADNILISGSTLSAFALVGVGGNINIAGNGSVEIDSSTIAADGNVNITAEQAVVGDAIYDSSGGVTISGGSITAGSVATPKTLSITANGTAGTTINGGATLNAFYITVNSPDGILINQDGSSSTWTGNQLNMTAGNGNSGGGPSIAIQNLNLNSFATVNMAAHTIDLLNVSFGGLSIVNLGSYFGVANIENGVVVGDVNLRSVFYGATHITSTSQIGNGIGTTPGIYVHAN